jgi:SagB-type dehydrogenase family enzyme
MSGSLFLSLRAGVSVFRGEGELVLQTTENRIAFRQLRPGLLAALQALADGGDDEVRLEERILQDGGAETLARFAYYLERLDRRGLLLRSVRSGDVTLMTLVPTTRYFQFAPRRIDPDQRYVLCRFSYARREGAQTVLESPLAHARILLHGARATAVLYSLSQPGQPAELFGRAADLSVAAIGLLLGAGMIREADNERPALQTWEFHDLLFHARTRMGRHDWPVGGTFPFAGDFPPPPALKAVQPKEWLDLYQPDLSRLQKEDPPLARVQGMQRTIRAHGDRPIDVRQLGEFLYRAARVRHCQQVQVETTHGSVQLDLALRPYPGGGALYELELYPVVNICNGLGSGLHYYDPLNHRLGLLSRRTIEVEQLLEAAARTAEVSGDRLQVLLVVAARFQRRAWQYASTAYSTTLKDVGVLYQTMYLVATVMGLAPCAVSGGDSDLFASVADTDYYAETSVGGFLLGRGPLG